MVTTYNCHTCPDGNASARVASEASDAVRPRNLSKWLETLRGFVGTLALAGTQVLGKNASSQRQSSSG